MNPERIKSIEYSSKFLKSLGKLPKRIIEQANEKEKLFKENPFHPQLKTHKLSGREKRCWALWIDYSYRIKFIFLSNEEVLFLDMARSPLATAIPADEVGLGIGTHHLYKH